MELTKNTANVICTTDVCLVFKTAQSYRTILTHIACNTTDISTTSCVIDCNFVDTVICTIATTYKTTYIGIFCATFCYIFRSSQSRTRISAGINQHTIRHACNTAHIGFAFNICSTGGVFDITAIIVVVSKNVTNNSAYILSAFNITGVAEFRYSQHRLSSTVTNDTTSVVFSANGATITEICKLCGNTGSTIPVVEFTKNTTNAICTTDVCFVFKAIQSCITISIYITCNTTNISTRRGINRAANCYIISISIQSATQNTNILLASGNRHVSIFNS